MTHAAEPADELLEQPADATRRSPWRWVSLTLAVIAVVATGVAVWALVRTPSEEGPPAPSAQQVAEAKQRVCAAYGQVRAAVALQTQATAGTDPIAVQAVAANARLAMSVGSQHLVDNLSPATPPELAALIRTLSTDLQNLTINALAGTADDEPGQVARLRDLETNSAKIVDLCK
ncbi:hypothetical protein [Mycolicibacterium sp.]|uniref:hypothetical protein n=1 Tax=Mycolicibacterium sp. TaxID=2320850 RepID=UPI001A192412|nr:hypothetical protein [Mycolicibacterium sp.]MBJ7341770.1 hypothetical protein [Mycolicibacterium sp.]